MQRYYQVTERATGESARVHAESAQDACAKVGWMIGYCFVKELSVHRERRRPPSIRQLEAWHAEGGCEATDGCWVEPDGYCEHGCPSWLLKLGLI